jgi:hypothetical protein
LGPARRLGRDAWGYFGLLAITGGFALVAQHFARRGEWRASLAASALAIALALFVVVRVWPRMARPGLAYQWTRLGALYVAALLIVALGAVSSANNLLFLVLACMLAALLASGFFSRMNLAELELLCAVPEAVFARQDVPVQLSLRNLKTWLASFSIWVRVEVPGEAGSPEVYFPMLPGRQTCSAVVTLRFPRRGVYQQDVFWLRSWFPFGFLLKSARLRLRREILVYPAVAPSPELEATLPRLTQQWERQQSGLGQDLYRIRPYQAGDSTRVVHWKASAHTGELKVREFTVEEDRRVEIIFDPAVPPGAEWRERFERGVEACASFAWRLHSQGVALRFAPGRLGGIYDILRFLALVEPEEGGEPLQIEPSGLFQVIFAASPANRPAVEPESSFCYYFPEGV